MNFSVRTFARITFWGWRGGRSIARREEGERLVVSPRTDLGGRPLPGPDLTPRGRCRSTYRRLKAEHAGSDVPRAGSWRRGGGAVDGRLVKDAQATAALLLFSTPTPTRHTLGLSSRRRDGNTSTADVLSRPARRLLCSCVRCLEPTCSPPAADRPPAVDQENHPARTSLFDRGPLRTQGSRARVLKRFGVRLEHLPIIRNGRTPTDIPRPIFDVPSPFGQVLSRQLRPVDKDLLATETPATLQLCPIATTQAYPSSIWPTDPSNLPPPQVLQLRPNSRAPQYLPPLFGPSQP